MPLTSAGQAFWNQRQMLASMAPRLRSLIEAVGFPEDMRLSQWAQLIAFAADFRPDLIVELGRAHGNSTCCFLETARHLEESGARCKLLSVCLDDAWNTQTVPRLTKLCGPDWFARGEIHCGNILTFDFAPHLAQAERILVFWDAHGPEVAECVLAGMMPRLASRPHRILMHDLSDGVHDVDDASKRYRYGRSHLWNGECASGHNFRLGNLESSVTQAILALDFAERNGFALHSASEEMQREVGKASPQAAELLQLLGQDMVSLKSHWFWFSLEEATRELTFPNPRPFVPPPPAPPSPLWRRVLRAGRRAARAVQHRVLQPAGATVAQSETALLPVREETGFRGTLNQVTRAADAVKTHPSEAERSEYWKDPFRPLAQKWQTIPMTSKGRARSKDLLQLPDNELLEVWSEAAREHCEGEGFQQRGWYHTLYEDFLRGKKVLDVGSGMGFSSIHFARKGAEVTFLDLAPNNLEVLRRVCRALKLDKVNFHVLKTLDSIKELPNNFDVVMAMGSLHHAPQTVIQPEVHELVKHLRVGGRWLQLAYPQARWVREGADPFHLWGIKTDGEGTPWAEWYDLKKLLALHEPNRMEPVFTYEWHDQDFNWFDLIYRGM